MTDYLLIISANILLAVTFALSKLYQKKAGYTAISGVSYNVQLGLYSSVIYLIANKFVIHLTAFSLIIALIQTLAVTLYTIIGFYMLHGGLIASYTMFLMSGGMIVPYLWGLLFLGEKFSVLRTVGILIILFGVILANYRNEKQSLKYIYMGIAIFLLNGITSVTTKVHQIETVRPVVSSMEFVILSNILKFLLSLVVLIFFIIRVPDGKEIFKITLNKKVLWIVIIASAIGGITSYCLVRGAINLPATVLYPLNTGGTIVLTAFTGMLFFKEKPEKRTVIGIISCLIGTLCFL